MAGPTHTPPGTRIIPASTVPLEAVLAFARRTYGRHAFQARAMFYRWCYIDNPHCTGGMAEAWVAVTGTGQVVGMMDKLYMEWNVHGTIMRIPATGNLALDPGFRKGGAGLRLILRYMRNEAHVLMNGANAQSAPLFRGLKYQELTGGYWGWMVLAPVRAAARFVRHRLLGARPGPPPRYAEANLNGHTVSNAPDDAFLLSLAGLLNDAPHPVKPHWTLPGLRWRCFHPEGPRHVVVHDRHGDGAMTEAMILAVGSRHGVLTARPIAHRCREHARFQHLLHSAVQWCREHGVDVMACFTLDPEEARMFEKAGIRARRQAPATFFYHHARTARFDDVLVQGIASDMGLEGMGTGK